ncbi:hypothetical protein CG709_06435, partial [Lachnotalea glycerini]
SINGVNLYELKSDDLIKYRRKNLGFIFQNFNLLPMLNVMEILYCLFRWTIKKWMRHTLISRLTVGRTKKSGHPYK